MRCRNCGACWQTHEEKMTDVNMAVELVVDGFRDRYDTALLISGDSDLMSTVTRIRGLFPEKSVIVGFPPNRSCQRLRRVATASFTIGRKKLADSQFPDEVTKPEGYILRRPATWV